MAPRSLKLRVYFKNWALPQASHYAILKRDSKGLFYLSSNRIMSIPVGAPIQTDGVLVTWPDIDPNIACGEQPAFARITGGGASVETLVNELNTVPELQRELSLGVETAAFLTSGKDFGIRVSPGKVVVRVSKISSEPAVTPHEFTIVRCRPYASNVTKPVCVLWGNVTQQADGLSDAPRLPRYIIPQIKDTEEFRTAIPELTRFLTSTLETRLLPYVLVTAPRDRHATCYALCYDYDGHCVYIAQLFRRLIANCIDLPTVHMVESSDGKHRMLPNVSLISYLHRQLFYGNLGDNKAFEARRNALEMVFKVLGYPSKNFIKLAFKNWHVDLTTEEIAQLQAWCAEDL